MTGGASILEPPVPDIGSGGPPPPADTHGGGRGGGDDGHEPGRRHRGPASVAVLGMWVALAPILMLFLAFASAYVMRHGLGSGWTPGPLPHLLWFNTAVLLTSGLALERARALERAGGRPRPWILTTLALGAIFVAGQLFAWFELQAMGFHVATTPHTSFFYLLTGAHAVHVLGGLAGLVALALWPEQGRRRATLGLALQVMAIYWHFLFVLWLGLFALLAFLR